MFQAMKAPLVPTVILMGQLVLANSKWASDWVVGLLIGFTAFWLLCSVLSSAAVIRKLPRLRTWAPFLDPTGVGLAASEISSNYVRGKTFRLIDVAIDGQVFNRTFEDCVIHGPAVVAPCEYTNQLDCEYEVTRSADQLYWVLDFEPDVTPLAALPQGAVVTRKCTFKRCRFVGVGWVTTKEDAKQKIVALKAKA